MIYSPRALVSVSWTGTIVILSNLNVLGSWLRLIVYPLRPLLNQAESLRTIYRTGFGKGLSRFGNSLLSDTIHCTDSIAIFYQVTGYDGNASLYSTSGFISTIGL
jgi:hypothetical protein